MNYSTGFRGWLGETAREVTYESVTQLADTLAGYYRKHQMRGQKLVIGYDTRQFAKPFAELIATVMAEQGIKVFFGNQPASSAVSVVSSIQKKSMGTVVVTGDSFAAHILGIKAFDKEGFALTDEVLAEFQTTGRSELPTNRIEHWIGSGFVEPYDPGICYRNYVEERIEFDALAASNRIVYDPLYGTGIHYFDRHLNEKGLRGYTMRRSASLDFEGLAPVPAEQTSRMYEEMLAVGAEIGLSVSPDCATFACMYGPNRLTPGQALFLIAEALVQKGETGALLVSEDLALDEKKFERLGCEFRVVSEQEFEKALADNTHLLAVDRLHRFHYAGSGVPDALLSGFYLVECFNRRSHSPKLLQTKMNEIREC